MRDRNRAVEQAFPTPVTTVNNTDDHPDIMRILTAWLQGILLCEWKGRTQMDW